MNLNPNLSGRKDYVNLAKDAIVLRNVKPATSNNQAVAYQQVFGAGNTYGGNNTYSGNNTHSGNNTFSGTNNFGVVTYKSNVIDTGGAYATPVVLTEAQSGSLILVDDAQGLDFTLPAITSSNIGMRFEFLVTVTITSNNFRVTAAAGDLLNGGVTMIDFDAAYTAPQAVFMEPDFSDDLIMTCNGSTTGGKKGTRVVFEAVSATQWFVSGTVAADGVIATCFS